MDFKKFLLLLLLAAIWGASFLFIRVGAPAFGPIALTAVRVDFAALFLVVMLLLRGGFKPLAGRWGKVLLVGVLNQAAPFCLFAYAELSLPAGITSIINATTPMWAAIVAFAWLGDRLNGLRIAGLLVGFGGVVLLIWQDIAQSSALGDDCLAALAVLAATLLYGISANMTKRFLTGMDSLAVATGSMIGAAAVLTLLALFALPTMPLPPSAWGSVLALGVVCTGVGYMIYFHLIATIGPARAVSVSFLMPVLGILWGVMFLDEHVSVTTVVGGAIIVLGTALASGFLKAPQRSVGQQRGGAGKDLPCHVDGR
ncbi:MAG: putative cystine transporter YijE [Pseudomonas sp.]|nr:MAG: putative cystine transporter YijE [Pseudomonas sp.]